jgi:rhomboid family GlyGly-CTERM serine protease
MKQIPYISLLLSALAGALMLLPQEVHNRLYFDYHLLSQGHLWGLVSGHWIHADIQHLIWNVAALAILATIIETRSRRLLLWSIVIGTACVDILLMSPISELQRYCGLSGLLNTLLGVALYVYWRETRSTAVIVVGILSVAKIALEMYSGHSVFTDISWPPFTTAHLAGILGAPIVIRGYYPERAEQLQPVYLR